MDKRCVTCKHSISNTGRLCPFVHTSCDAEYSQWKPMAGYKLEGNDGEYPPLPPEVQQEITPVVNPFAYQVGGQHYQKNDTMGPAEWCLRHKLGHGESCAIKYIFRHKDKGGLESLRKAKQYLEFIAYLEYGENL